MKLSDVRSSAAAPLRSSSSSAVSSSPRSTSGSSSIATENGRYQSRPFSVHASTASRASASASPSAPTRYESHERKHGSAANLGAEPARCASSSAAS